MVVVRGLRGRGNGELLLNEYGVSVWNDGKFWRWTVVIVVQPQE